MEDRIIIQSIIEKRRSSHMIKTIKQILPMILISGLMFAQSIQGNFDLNAAIVEYTYVVRDSVSADDANSSYAVTASWPSSAAAAAGMGYTHALKEFETGDTIAVALVPLINETYLQMFGVAMNVNLDDGGTFSINAGSTYPTTDAENCSTYVSVPAVQESGDWTGTTGFTHPDNPNAYSMGWGITLSSVFAQFNAPDLVGGVHGVNYGVGTTMENWGMITIDYTDDTHATPAGLEIYWEAHDGVGSGLGVDATGALNGFTGVPVAPGDTVTILNTDAYLAYYDTTMWNDLGWTGDDNFTVPMLGGKGQTIDPSNPDTYEINPMTGDTLPAGIVEANHGYLFDPAGGDGVPFNGDEALAPTAYFFTYNFLEASMIFSEVFAGMLAAGVDAQTALSNAADSVAFVYVDATTSAAIGGLVGASLYDEYVACLGTGGGDACDEIFRKGPTMTLAYVKVMCPDGAGQCGVDDSGWDYDGEDGRLIFEVDNRCIPDNTTQRVNTFWTSTALDVDTDAPLAQKFEVYGNYPNPFNPVTSIKFATEKFSHVNVTIYSLLGEEVMTLHNGDLNAGTYSMTWNGKNHFGNAVPSGMYVYRVNSDNRTFSGKMLLLK